MRAHCFQHVSFEGMGAIEQWLNDNNFGISYTRFYESSILPDIADIDWLIIMGGPMSVNDEQEYPWLISEKQFIRECIAKQKKVIGICLGSQLIASAMGCSIYKNKEKEIGWFPIQFNIKNKLSASTQAPQEITVFHWHGETFDLPGEATLLASTESCTNQIFTIGENVIGFQCHLETTEKSLDAIIKKCEKEIVPAPYIQSTAEMKQKYSLHATQMHQLLYNMLNTMNVK